MKNLKDLLKEIDFLVEEKIKNEKKFSETEVAEKRRYQFFQILEERLSQIIQPTMNIENSHLEIERDLLSSRYKYHDQLNNIKEMNNIFDIIDMYKKYCYTFTSFYFVPKLNNTILDILKNFEKYFDLEGNNSSGCQLRIDSLKKTIKYIPLISDGVRSKLMKIPKDVERRNSQRPF